MPFKCQPRTHRQKLTVLHRRQTRELLSTGIGRSMCLSRRRSSTHTARRGFRCTSRPEVVLTQLPATRADDSFYEELRMYPSFVPHQNSTLDSQRSESLEPECHLYCEQARRCRYRSNEGGPLVAGVTVAKVLDEDGPSSSFNLTSNLHREASFHTPRIVDSVSRTPCCAHDFKTRAFHHGSSGNR